MNSLFHRFAKTTALSLALSSFGASSVLAFDDVLDTPAFTSELASSSLLVDIEAAGDRLVAVGTRGHIVYSDDKGASWQQAAVPVSVLLTSVDFATDQKGWAVGHGGVILHSNDGGMTWQKQFDGDLANKSIIEQSQDYVEQLEQALEQASEGELEDLEYELEEAEYSLEDALADAEVGASKPFLDVMFVDAKKGFAVGAYGFLFATEDGGRSWTNQGGRLDNLDRFHLNTISQIPGGTILIVGEAGVIFRSSDLGESWEVLDSPYEGSFFGIQGLVEKGHALIYGLRGNLFRTTNSGSSWDEVESNTESSLMGSSFDGNRKVSIAGNSGVIALSEDGGETFTINIRESRLGNTALTYVKRQQMVLVGEYGVLVVTPSGNDI
jgi:photosystem II stability/assembly factor-like uncharacterized protein